MLDAVACSAVTPGLGGDRLLGPVARTGGGSGEDAEGSQTPGSSSIGSTRRPRLAGRRVLDDDAYGALDLADPDGDDGEDDADEELSA
jgi:hypothetical protein